MAQQQFKEKNNKKKQRYLDPTSAKKSAMLPQSNDNQTMIRLFCFFVDNNQEDF